MRVVSGICVREDGCVLMGLRRLDKLRPGLWELPGGKVDPGETDHDAIRREWREELGVEVEVTGEALADSQMHVDVNIEILLYRVTIIESIPRCIDHAELQWVMPIHAVRHLPCSPGFYLQYRAILDCSTTSRGAP